jgi:hypothetical protein
VTPLTEWPLAARRGLVGVFTDIDDTLTTEGAISADALAALADLRTAGLHRVAITGRPVIGITCRPASCSAAIAHRASGVAAPSVVRVSSMSVKTPTSCRRSAAGQSCRGFIV